MPKLKLVDGFFLFLVTMHRQITYYQMFSSWLLCLKILKIYTNRG
jgi:hypothetical protein